jgi:hypothetical protein
VISGPNFAASRAKRYAPLPRALAATDADHNKGIEGEAVAIVHAQMFAFCSLPVKRLPDRRHGRFKLKRQDGKANDEGGTMRIGLRSQRCARSA